MTHFSYEIQNNKIVDDNGEVSGSGDFQHIEKSFGEEEIYCKTKDGKISEIICEALTEKSAKKAVSEYLSSLQGLEE